MYIRACLRLRALRDVCMHEGSYARVFVRAYIINYVRLYLHVYAHPPLSLSCLVSLPYAIDRKCSEGAPRGFPARAAISAQMHVDIQSSPPALAAWHLPTAGQYRCRLDISD